jgi:hypothetical protein
MVAGVSYLRRMGLLVVWGAVVAYFLVLIVAVGLEFALAGSAIFFLFAVKVTLQALPPLSLGRRVHHPPPPAQPDQPANLNRRPL